MWNHSIRSAVAVIVLVSLVGATSTETPKGVILVNEEPVKYLGGMPNFDTAKAMSGQLTITTETILFESKKASFDIDPTKLTYLQGDEPAKRRVKRAIVGAVLLTPLGVALPFVESKSDNTIGLVASIRHSWSSSRRVCKGTCNV